MALHIAQLLLALHPQAGGKPLMERIQETLADALTNTAGALFLSGEDAMDAHVIGQTLREITANPQRNPSCDLRALRFAYIWDGQQASEDAGTPQDALERTVRAACEVADRYGISDVRHVVLWKLGNDHARAYQASLAPALAILQERGQHVKVYLLHDLVDTGAILGGIGDEAIAQLCLLCACGVDERNAVEGFSTVRICQLDMKKARFEELMLHRSAERLEAEMDKDMGANEFASRFLKKQFGMTAWDDSNDVWMLRKGMQRAISRYLPQEASFCAVLPQEPEDIARTAQSLCDANLGDSELDWAVSRVLREWRVEVDEQLLHCLQLKGARALFTGSLRELLLRTRQAKATAEPWQLDRRKLGEGKTAYLMRNMLKAAQGRLALRTGDAVARLCDAMLRELGSEAEGIPALIGRMTAQRLADLAPLKLPANRLSLFVRWVPGVDEELRRGLEQLYSFEKFASPDLVLQGKWRDILRSMAEVVRSQISLASLTQELNTIPHAVFSAKVQERMEGGTVRLLPHARDALAETSLRIHYIASEGLWLTDDRRLPEGQYELHRVSGTQFDNLVYLAELSVGPTPDSHEARMALLHSLPDPPLSVAPHREAQVNLAPHSQTPSPATPAQHTSALPGLAVRLLPGGEKASLSARDWGTESTVTVTVAGYDKSGAPDSQSKQHSIASRSAAITVDLRYGVNKITALGGFGAIETVTCQGRQRTLRCSAKPASFSLIEPATVQLDLYSFKRYTHSLLDHDGSIGGKMVAAIRRTYADEDGGDVTRSFILPLRGKGPWSLWQPAGGDRVVLEVRDERRIFALRYER